MKKVLSITAICLLGLTANAQSTSNLDFENWTNDPTLGFPMPDGFWATNGLYATTQEIIGSQNGANHVRLNTLFVPAGVPFPAQDTVVPGICMTGALNTTTFQIEAGEPWTGTGQPASFDGYVKYTTQGNDTSIVYVEFLFGGNIIGIGIAGFSGAQTNWTNVNIPISWSTADTPDSVTILFASSAGNLFNIGTDTDGTVFEVDNFSFSGGGTSSIEEVAETKNVSIFPNPAKDLITITTNNNADKVELYDITGKLVKTISVTKATTITSVSNLDAGVYFYKATKDDAIVEEGKIQVIK